MSTDAAQPTLHDVGYRRAILALGACWGTVPALTFGLHSLASLSVTEGVFVIGALMTLSLGLLYEFDSRTLAEHGRGVPLAWSYALVAPISGVVWGLFGPAIAQIPVLGLLVGPPASALLYVWQRGRHASVQ